MQHDRSLDCRGMNCPLPVLHARKAMNKIESGQVLELIADAATISDDMYRWCKSTGHKILETKEDEKLSKFYIQKA